MIFFSQRMAIEKKFLKWCKENNVAEKPNSLIAFMEINGWLNEEKIEKDFPLGEAQRMVKYVSKPLSKGISEGIHSVFEMPGEDLNEIIERKLFEE